MELNKDKDKDTVKEEIINVIQSEEYDSLSDIANKLSIPHLRIVEYINELKSEGIIDLDDKPPFVKLAK